MKNERRPFVRHQQDHIIGLGVNASHFTLTLHCSQTLAVVPRCQKAGMDSGSNRGSPVATEPRPNRRGEVETALASGVSFKGKFL